MQLYPQELKHSTVQGSSWHQAHLGLLERGQTLSSGVNTDGTVTSETRNVYSIASLTLDGAHMSVSLGDVSVLRSLEEVFNGVKRCMVGSCLRH